MFLILSLKSGFPAPPQRENERIRENKLSFSVLRVKVCVI